MRVTLIGSHGVGKTTLTQPVAEVLGLPVVPEAVRAWCAEQGIDHIGNVPDVEVLQWGVLSKQIQIEDKMPEFLSDRSPLDSSAYYAEILGENTIEAKAYLDRARTHCFYRYDLMILVPAREDIPLQGDGFRGTNRDFQLTIDRRIRKLVEDWELQYKVYELKSKGIQDRINEAVLAVEAARSRKLVEAL